MSDLKKALELIVEEGESSLTGEDATHFFD